MARKLEFDHVTTRGGDGGESSLFDGERRSKSDVAFETLGDLDELTSWLGVVRARHRTAWSGPLRDLDAELSDVQIILSRIAALVACRPGSEPYGRLVQVDDETVEALELREARLLTVTRIEPRFIIPGDDEAASELDFARSVCRRCERRLVGVIRDAAQPRPDLHAAQHYLNRLSDFLFVAARTAEQTSDA
jgi:cob(I)alamin adenosyltransferase